MLEPKKGLLTFRAEGNDFKSSQDYSRKIHWPGVGSSCGNNASGVTIGRGFDLGKRTKISSLMILQRAQISAEQSELIANGSGMKGCSAYQFVKKNRDRIAEITELQQLTLFNITYSEMEKDVERICKKRDVIKTYHPIPDTSPEIAWKNIPEIIKEVLIDL